MHKSLTFILFFLLNTTSIFAGGFQLHYHSQRQSGMGGTGTGLLLEGSSIFFNPGSLAFNNSNSVQFGTNALFSTTSFLARTPSIYQTDMDTLLFTPIQFYGVWKGKEGSKIKKWVFGLGVNNPFVAGSKWKDDWIGLYISQEFAINTFFIQPTASYKLTDKIGIGLGVSYGLLNLFSRSAIDGTNQNGKTGSASFSGTGDGIGLNAGILIEANERLTLGLSYRTQVKVNINTGIGRFEVPESLQEKFPNVGFTTDITLPSVLNLGIGYRPDDKWILAFDINFIGWSSFDSLKLVYDKELDNLQEYPEEKAFKNTMSYRAGLEYKIGQKLRIRGGVYFDQSPIQNGFVSPELPDANRIGLSAGIGINIAQNLSIASSYLFEYTGERTAILSQSVFGGTYKSNSTMYGIGLKYRF